MGKRVLLVGAYERDNFGDLLFLLLSQHYFRSVAVTASAPMAADMSSLLDQQIVAYGPLLRQQNFDHIWTVGGEVGGVTPLAAFEMSAPRDLLQSYVTSRDQLRILAEAFGGGLVESPYIPRPTAYPKNALATLGLNSVGLSGIGRIAAASRSRLLSTLRMATPISVRDEASSRYLKACNIKHSLVPDLVHSIALIRPREPANNSDYILVQASNQYLDSVGEEAFAESIAQLGRQAGSEIRLFVAGTASGHDSVASYGRIVATIARISPEVGVSISSARRPWDRVDEIRNARLWIGTSLHGRIVSAAHGIRRVSLDIGKVNRYAATWDPDMPYSVRIEEVVDAAVSALTESGGTALLEHGRSLGDLADENMRTAVAATIAGEFDPSVEDRFASLEALRASEAEHYELQQSPSAAGLLKEGIRRGVLARTSPQFREFVRGVLAKKGRR